MVLGNVFPRIFTGIAHGNVAILKLKLQFKRSFPGKIPGNQFDALIPPQGNAEGGVMAAQLHLISLALHLYLYSVPHPAVLVRALIWETLEKSKNQSCLIWTIIDKDYLIQVLRKNSL